MRDVKSGWCSAQDIVNEHGITVYELFEHIRVGLPAYTNTHNKVVNSDYLLDVKKVLLEYFKAQVKNEYPDRHLHEYEIDVLAKHKYDIRFKEIFDHPQGIELISFNELLRNSLSDVWTFQFKTADVDRFFELDQQILQSDDNILKEQEQQTWKMASAIIEVSSEEIKRVAADYVREDLQNIMTKNREVIRTKAEEEGSEADNSLLSIILDNRSTISELANSEGTEGDRELKAFHLISALAESEEVRNAVHEYNQNHSTKASETSLPHAMQEQPEKPIGITTIPTDKQPELETTKTTQPPVNFFHKKSSDIWHIGYAGNKAEIKHYNGFSYIAEILRQKPGESVSCIALAQMVSNKGREKVVSEDAAMDEDLYFDHDAQLINTPKARIEYLKRHNQLRDRLSEIEDLPEHERPPDANLEKVEIEEEMSKIEIALKEKTFTEPNAKKAQSNIKQRLDSAYTAIRKAGMNNLANYLEQNIKSDGAFGLHHTGTLAWEIVIK